VMIKFFYTSIAVSAVFCVRRNVRITNIAYSSILGNV
jgi:hypothetical protein